MIGFAICIFKTVGDLSGKINLMAPISEIQQKNKYSRTKASFWRPNDIYTDNQNKILIQLDVIIP